MILYQGQHRAYCGVDLHARTMYLCVLAVAVLVEHQAVAPEHARRHVVIRRRSSGGTDRASGGRFAGRMMAGVATCRRQGRPVPTLPRPAGLPQGVTAACDSTMT
jgi:hypothetical protein